MHAESRLFINGKLVAAASGKTYPNLNPATEEMVGEVADAGLEDMDQAIAAARRAFDETDWATNHAFRLHCLQQLKAGLVAEMGNLKEQIAVETGSPLGICGAGGPQCEVPIGFLDFTLETLPEFQWSRDIGVSNMMGVQSRRLVEKEAIGVVACITPWNVPLQINLAKCVPALAAGCTVVLKPAPDTPWAATALGRIVSEYTDIPPGVFNVVTAEDPVATGEALVRDPRVDMVSFTGSTGVGKRIMAMASETVKKVFLELGGKSANIILDDANLEQSLLSALSVCFHAGQGCAIPTRLLIPRDRQAEVEALLKTYFGFIEYGDPGSETQIMGSLVNARQRERVLAYIEKGKQEGARLLLGGGVPAHLDKGFYVEPTVFMDVSNDMTIAREEIFGPVLAVIACDGEEDAIRIANDSDYGLSAGVWSASEDRALAVARRLRTGTVNINGGNFYGADAPFGGYKQSGLGREMGREGFEEYLETKTIALAVSA
ncbi:aldehyde dehydrogenase family protein [Haliea sp. E1-2-M8]|uniref:aldehyde dehydrogenase family protein n=1 Tax=Haliea sp. E1-2-M8 TaxID=3064706 RepID=UPI00272775E4|nr:aldehyde dehydrogenase family protein [Haliea sp. E1-2-M8]MDO8863011.1 aldehyde dehydrogenase family protein [Haliea sp. E1-2-M8]